MRSIFAIAALLATATFGPPAGAQEAVPAGAQEAAPVVRVAPQTPEGLVDKSVRDLAHGKIGAAIKDDVKALQRGPLLIHGNYCGVGNRPGTPPVDALDAACMRHDACTTTGKLPSCACDDRLRIEAAAIADDPSSPPDEKSVAIATVSAMAVLVCKTASGAPSVPAAAAPVVVVPAPH